MKRDEFLTALRERLKGLPQDEMDAAVQYYEEYLEEAEDEEAAIRGLGSPEQIAARILADVERQDAAQAVVPAEPVKKRSPWKTVGMVVLLVCASPLLISLGAVALSVVISLAAALVSLIIAVIAPFLSLSLALIASCFLLLGAAGSVMGVSMPVAVLLCGVALLCGALGIASGIFTGYLCKWAWLLVREICRALKFKKKGAAAA